MPRDLILKLTGGAHVRLGRRPAPGGGNGGAAPLAPTNFQAAPIDARFEGAWVDTNAGAASYVVEHSADEVNWTPINTTAGATRVVSEPLDLETLCQVQIKAVNDFGESAYVGPIPVTTLWLGGQAPTRPIDLIASAMGPTRIEALYMGTASANGTVSSGGILQYGIDGVTFPYSTTTTLPGTTIFDVTGLVEDTLYYFQVVEQVGGGVLYSLPSTVVSCRTLPEMYAVADPPTGVTAVLVGTHVHVTWTDASGGTSATRIERSLDGGTLWTEVGPTPAGVTSLDDARVWPHADFLYRGRSISEGGFSDPSAPSASVATGAWATSGAIPATPTGLVALSSTGSEVYLYWTVLDELEDGFEIQVRPVGSGTWTAATLAGSGATTVPARKTDAYVNGLTESTDHEFRIRAVNAAGASAWSSIATATTYATGVSWAGSHGHAPRMLVSPRWKAGLLQGEADFAAWEATGFTGPTTFALWSWYLLQQAGQWPTGGGRVHLAQYLALWYALTGDAAAAAKCWDVMDTGGTTYLPSSNDFPRFGHTGTVTSVTDGTHIRIGGFTPGAFDYPYTTNALKLKYERVTFNTGANAATGQRGWYITDYMIVDGDVNGLNGTIADITLDAAPGTTVSPGDSLTLFHAWEWSGNQVRDQFVEQVAIYDLIYPALDAAQRLKFLNYLNNFGDLVSGNHVHLEDRKVNRIDDSDALMGAYFGASVLDNITANLDNDRAGTFLSSTWTQDDGVQYYGGGLDATGSAAYNGDNADPDTWTSGRNALRAYASRARSGEWIESSMYNPGTLLYAIWATNALWHTLGADHFPEYAELLRAYARSTVHRWAPTMDYNIHWGDEEESGGTVRKGGGVHVFWMVGAAWVGQGVWDIEPYIADMLHTLAVVNPGTAVDPGSQGHSSQPRMQYGYDAATPHLPRAGSRLYLSPDSTRTVAIHRDAWDDPDSSWFWSLTFGGVAVDHENLWLNLWSLVRNQERVFSQPSTYTGGFAYFTTREDGANGGIVLGGLSPPQTRGALGHEGVEGEYIFTQGSAYGTGLKSPHQPPVALLERTHRKFYFPSPDDSCDVIVTHDRVLGRNPECLVDVGSYPGDTYRFWPAGIVEMSPAPTTTTLVMTFGGGGANGLVNRRCRFIGGVNAGLTRYVAANTAGYPTTITLDEALPRPAAAGDYVEVAALDTDQGWLQRQHDFDLACFEQVFYAPPGITPDISDPVRSSWTTPGGQLVAIDHLRPASFARDVSHVISPTDPFYFNYHTIDGLWESASETEFMTQCRLMALPKWPATSTPTRVHFLNVWSGRNPGITVTSTRLVGTGADAVDAAHIARTGEDDLVVAFGANPVDRTCRAGYALGWTAVAGSTRVYLADLDSTLSWTTTVDGGAPAALDVSDLGVGRLTVGGTGAHTITISGS